jgi:hypothetical protein
LAADFAKFRPIGGDTFCPKFCPQYAKSKVFNSSAYTMYLAVFYVGEYVCMCGCVGVYTKSKSTEIFLVRSVEKSHFVKEYHCHDIGQ